MPMNGTPTQEDAEEQINNVEEAVEFVEQHAEGSSTRPHKENDSKQLVTYLIHTTQNEGAGGQMYVVLIAEEDGQPYRYDIAGLTVEIKDAN